MTPILAGIGRYADAALERLRLWSQAGYVAPFIWAGSDGAYAIVERGDVRTCGLGEALDGRSTSAFVVGVALPSSEESISRDDLAHVERVQRAFEAAVPGAEAPWPTVLLFPLGDTTAIEAPKEGSYRSTFVVVPEDQSGPREANRFNPQDEDEVVAHVAHAIACLNGLFGGAGAALLDPQPGELPQATGVPVSFVRCHSRLVDAGFLLDALAAKAFTSAREGWPNPDRSRFDRGGLSTAATETLVEEYLGRHEDVFGLRPVEALTTPEPQRLSLLAALRAVMRFWIAEIKRRPYEWFDDRLERLWDGVVVTSVERLGRAEGIHVVRWHERPPQDQISRFIAAELAKPVPAPDGPIGPAWRELAALTIGLVDGRDLPVATSQAPGDERRRLETRPAELVPDPIDLPPLEPRPQRACDPAALEPLIQSVLAPPPIAASPTDDAGTVAADGRDAPAATGAPAADPAAAAAQALQEERLRVIHEWYSERNQTLVWRAGQKLVERMGRAKAESEVPAEEDWARLEESIAENKTLDQRRFRRRRLWLVVRTLLAFAATVWLVVGHLPDLLKPVGVLLVILLWFALLIWGWWRARSGTSRRERETYREAEALVHRAVVGATRRGDHERLQRRYAEYLDWAEMIGHLVHRPWVSQLTPYGRPEDLQTPPDPESLPAACKLAYAVFSEPRLRRISALAETTVFRVGWLADLVDETIEKASRDWLELHPLRSGDMTVVPDAYADVSGDPDNLRAHVLRWVRLGHGRSISDSGLAAEYADRVGRERAPAVLTELVDAATSADAPLPPAAEWFSSPEGIERLSAQVSEFVVGITALTDGGSSWRGSGVLIENAGLVATCRHCVEVEGGASFAITTVDGRTFDAELVATASDADVALVRAKAETAFPAAEFGRAEGLVQGLPIFTLGYPFFSHETGGPSLAWGVVTAPRRDVRGDRGTLETRIQTNYPAGGGASGSPVFDTSCQLIGIHTGGYSEPGAEERSAHVSFAVPIERVVQLMTDSGLAAPVALPAELPQANGEDSAETFTLSAFLEPILDSSETFLGEHGALTTMARRCATASIAPPELSDGPLAEAPLAGLANQPIRVGTPLRMIATRIDQTGLFDVRRRPASDDRLPWFMAALEAADDVASMVTGESDAGDSLG